MGSNEWVLDSGAALHFTSNFELLHDLKLLETPVQFALGPNGEALQILWSGTVRTEKLNIPDVLFVPGLGMNVISVSKLSDDHDMFTTIRQGFCTLALASGDIAGQAVLRDGRYLLQYLIIGQDADATLPTGLEQPELEETSDQERSQQELPLDEPAASQAKQEVAHAKQRVLARFGFSRFNRRPDDQRELPIRVGMAYYGAAPRPYDRNDFILDSGTTHHMVPDRTLLDPDRETNIDRTDERFPGHIIRDVQIANNTLLPVAGIGNITNANGVTLQNVLHVPGLPANLVSVSQLMTELTSQLEDQLRQDLFAIILDGTGQAELQIPRLTLQIGITIFPKRDVVDEAHPVTIGEVQVGNSSVDANGQYHLHELQPCPEVNLVANWSIRKAQ